MEKIEFNIFEKDTILDDDAAMISGVDGEKSYGTFAFIGSPKYKKRGFSVRTLIFQVTVPILTLVFEQKETIKLRSLEFLLQNATSERKKYKAERKLGTLEGIFYSDDLDDFLSVLRAL